jgi:TonB-linked SusC/RagA family outer membrane protein
MSEFRIRGAAFDESHGALVLIDGVEGDINSVDPADVESIYILKDASATAIYGMRGANGAVLITTKRGSNGKMSVTGRANVSLSIPKRLPEYLRAGDYAALANEAREVRGERPIYSPFELDLIQKGLDGDMLSDVDWQNEALKQVSLKHNWFVSGRGGSDVARYYISLGLSNDNAAYRADRNSVDASNVAYNTYNYRANFDIHPTTTTSLRLGLNGFASVNRTPGVANTDDLWHSQWMYTPLIPIRYSTGEFAGAKSGELPSPYVLLNHAGRNSYNTYKGQATLAIEQNMSFLVEGLSLSAQGAYDLNSYSSDIHTVRPALYHANGRDHSDALILEEIAPSQTKHEYDLAQYRRLYFKGAANWQKSFDNHSLSAMLNYEISDGKYTGLNNSYLNAIPERFQSVAGGATYSFRDTYVADINFSYFGAENFEPGRQYGLFPSVGLGWIPTGYKWVMDNLSWLNFLKIRATYGTVGNNLPSGYRRFSYLSSLLRDSDLSVTVPDNFRWEKSTKGNIGIEGRLFNEKLTFTVDLFNDSRKDIFQQRRWLPEYVGQTGAVGYGNVGRIKSSGADGNIAYSHEVANNLLVTLRGNFIYSRNRVISSGDELAGDSYLESAGYPDGAVRGFQSLGLFRSDEDVRYSPAQTWSTVMPGDIKYKDINGDGKIDESDKAPLSYGAYPLLMYGFGAEINYKSLTVGVMFKGTGRTDYFRSGANFAPFAQYGLGNVLDIVADPGNRWIPSEYAAAHGIDPALARNPDAQFPRLQYGDNLNNSQLSDFWKGNARYLRLQEVSVGYNLNLSQLRSVGIQSLDLQLIGNNLHVWDKVKIFDPEQAQYGGLVYPIPATLSLQIYINI